MSSSLPRHPNTGILKKQAKMLLVAQRRGATPSCSLFRRLRRFSSSNDAEILAASVSLAEAQHALALHYGHRNWKDLMEEARSHPPSSDYSLDGVRARAEEPIPEYAGAGVPLAVVAGLNHAGFPIGFMEFAAASGWAFSFGYQYGEVSPAFMAVRGRPDHDGPIEVFQFIPRELGLEYEMALTQDPENLWAFVQEKVDAGIPVMSEHLDGGLITAYRIREKQRQIFFDGTVDTGWRDAGSLQPYAVYSFAGVSAEPTPDGAASTEEFTQKALRRAVEKGRPHEFEGIPQGLAALRAYLADVADPAKDFSECEEWFCWAAFERLMARRCAEVWLHSVAADLDPETGRQVSQAAECYGQAFVHYDAFLGETQGCNPLKHTLFERARTPERINASLPHLENGIESEAQGLDALEGALTLMEGTPDPSDAY